MSGFILKYQVDRPLVIPQFPRALRQLMYAVVAGCAGQERTYHG